eukprot:SAG22_NODE_2150_length_2929_cov_16.327208_2_plen_104_part_00
MKDLAKMLLDLFGNVQQLRENAGALLVGISQVMTKDEDDDLVTREDVHKELTDTRGLSLGKADSAMPPGTFIFVPRKGCGECDRRHACARRRCPRTTRRPDLN